LAPISIIHIAKPLEEEKLYT